MIERANHSKRRELLGAVLTISGLIEAVLWVAVTGKDDHFVTSILKSNSGIDNKPLSAAYAKVRV